MLTSAQQLLRGCRLYVAILSQILPVDVEQWLLSFVVKVADQFYCEQLLKPPPKLGPTNFLL